MDTENKDPSTEAVKDAGSIDTGGVTWDDRKWLDDAITSAGGKVTDSGMGCGGADLGYTINGRAFSVNMKWREHQQTKAA